MKKVYSALTLTLLAAVGGLFDDPTADCEGDDFQDTVPTCDDAGRIEIRGKTSLLLVDVCDVIFD